MIILIIVAGQHTEHKGIDCGLGNCFGMLKNLTRNISIKECDTLNFDSRFLNVHYLFGNVHDTIPDLVICGSL